MRRSSAPIFSALGDEVRLRLVARLCREGPLSIAALTQGTELTRQAVTKHLRVLEDAGVVQSERVGRASVWRLKPERLDEARRHLERISARWESAIERLRALVEDGNASGREGARPRSKDPGR